MSILSGTDCGTLKLIPPGDRNTTWDIVDASVDVGYGTESADLSAKVPNGTKAIMGWAMTISTDTSDLGILSVRDYGTNASAGSQTYTIYFGAEVGALGYRWGGALIIPATNGKFEYCTNGTYTIDAFYFILWGYYI
jgi:hypothetical protein